MVAHFDNTRDTFEQRLQALSRSQCELLILDYLDINEDFATWLDTRLIVAHAQTGESIDPKLLLHSVETVFFMRPMRHRWRHQTVLDIDEPALDELVDAIELLLGSGRGQDALTVLVPTAATLAKHWPECADHDETLHQYFPKLDALIAQAVLMTDVPRDFREDLVDDLNDWQNRVAEYGADMAFSTAIDAALRGWDDPGLEDVLLGHIQSWAPTGKEDSSERRLTQARLAALSGSGRYDAYLNLSRSADFYCEHSAMLAQVGRVEDAVKIAKKQLSRHNDIQRVAESIMAAGQSDTALALADWGLSLPLQDDNNLLRSSSSVSLVVLARWLRDTAHRFGRQDLTVKAAQAAFEQSFSRQDFRDAFKVSNTAAWPTFREDLIRSLLAAPYATDRIEILLEEDRIDDAVSCVDPVKTHVSVYATDLQRLAERAYAKHPEWTIALAFRVAKPIMDEGRSKYYQIAADWLAIAARAHRASGQSQHWQIEIDTLIHKHFRKYGLRPLLQALRDHAH